MNLISCTRVHPLEIAIDGLVMIFPVTVFGADAIGPVTAIVVIRLAHSLLLHSNADWDWGWIGRCVICSPRYHQIHHSMREERMDSNFAAPLVVCDRMFGTRYTGAVPPGRYGIDDNVLDRMGYFRTLIHAAFRRYEDFAVALVRALSPRRHPGCSGVGPALDVSSSPLTPEFDRRVQPSRVG